MSRRCRWSTFRLANTVEDRTLFQTRAEALDFDWAIWTNDRGLTPEVDPLFLLPGRGQTVTSHWFNWYATGGSHQWEAPTGDELKAYQLYDEIKSTADQKRLVSLMRELIGLNAKNMWYIGTVGELDHVVIVNNRMYNVPEKAVSDWLQKTPGNTWPEQYAMAAR